MTTTPASSHFNGGTITTPLNIQATTVVAPLIAENSDGWGLNLNSLGRLTVTSDDPAPFTVSGNACSLSFGSLIGLGFVGLDAAPADNTIPPGGVALWFDKTNGVGATKLMVKGKSADGTVKSAAIVLA